jgi:hypothetical protein
MKKNVISPVLLIMALAVLYRVIPCRPPGFAPQIAMFLFLPLFFYNKVVGFMVPLLSLFVSDLLYHFLNLSGASTIPGFYQGQLINYGMLALTPALTSLLLQTKKDIFLFRTITGSTVFFILSNTSVWVSPYALRTGSSFSAYLLTLYDGIPFYLNSLVATLLFGALICYYQAFTALLKRTFTASPV